MPSNTKPRVFVTGASGFVGSHVVYQLLEAGYPVLGAARGAKVPLLKQAFAKYPNFEAVDVPDISSSDLTKTLKGVDAIIHTAAPGPGRADVETALKTAIEGSVHVIRDGVKAGVKKAVVTSSTVSFPFSGPWGVDDWNPVTKEDALNGDHFTVYFAEKKLADQAILEFADEHPEIDVTLLGPCWIFGPFVPGFEHIVPEPDFKSFSTNGFIYALLRPDNTYFPTSPGFVDARDVAKAHIAALGSKPSLAVGRKRYVLMSPEHASYTAAINYIAEAHPEIKHRLADPDKAPNFAFETEVERKGLEDVVGFKADSYKSWKDTVLDTVDSLLAFERLWRDKGFEFEQPNVSVF